MPCRYLSECYSTQNSSLIISWLHVSIAIIMCWWTWNLIIIAWHPYCSSHCEMGWIMQFFNAFFLHLKPTATHISQFLVPWSILGTQYTLVLVSPALRYGTVNQHHFGHLKTVFLHSIDRFDMRPVRICDSLFNLRIV